MADIRIKDLANIATKINSSTTLDYLPLDKTSPDRTERITPEVLFSMDETKIPFIGQNYVVINAKGTDEQNYSALLGALSLVNALTPNGVARSATNRATLYLLNGRYVTASSVVALQLLQFVDIIGIGNRESIHIGSNSSLPVIKLQNANDNVFKNFTIENLGAGESFGWNTGQTDNSIMDSIVINSRFNEGVTYSGTYTNLVCNSDNILNGVILNATVDNCRFMSKSCGYSTSVTVQLSGSIKNSTGVTYCFGAGDLDVDMNAYIENCSCSGNSNYGFTGSGTVTYFNDSKIIDCDSEGASFGLGAIAVVSYADSLILNCTSTDVSFGCSYSGSVSLYGTIKNCTATDRSFGSTTTGPVINEGVIENCKANLLSFGSTSSSGRLINCKRLGSYGVHAGFIEKCDFVGDLIISSGATVRRCDIDQGKIDASTAINAKIYLNSLDQVFSVNITNLIGTPYNVVDNNI